MTLELLTSWWNLVFVVPFSLALAYLGLYTASGWTFGEGDVDAHAEVDADADTDVDAGGDVDGDADVDADADADAEHDVEAEGGREVPWHFAVLSWLGVGRVPLSIVLMIFCFAWGAIGFMANQVVRAWVPAEWMVAGVSLPLAVVGAVLVTSGVGNTVGRLMPMTETSARPKRSLVGRVGEAIFAIDAEGGTVSVRDGAGQLLHVPCRVAGSSGAARGGTIPKGSRVLLFQYNERDGLFYGSPYDEVPVVPPERELQG